MCGRCKELWIPYAIEDPADLTKAIHVVGDNLADGTLIEEPPASGSREPRQPFATLSPAGPWPDVVQCYFRCTSCGSRFRLFADTYHGSGEWEPA